MISAVASNVLGSLLSGALCLGAASQAWTA